MRVSIKPRILRLKTFMIASLVLGVYIFIVSIIPQVWYSKMTSFPKPVVLPYVMVHLDLKGTPLKLSYLQSLLPSLKKNGANSLLVEYEDMFPYEGSLANLSAENCYQKNELKKFLTLAKESGFDIIPLVQTFGHMEHVLKLAEFQHLREVPKHPDSICPSHPETMVLLREMLQQVIHFHHSISPLKYIHIGCDEVFNINKCNKCASRYVSSMDIFLRHVKTLSDVVKSLNGDATVLIWDDMLRGIKPYQWKHVEYFDNVEPVYWDYSPVIQVHHIHFLMYHYKFKNIWIASAFKGADGRAATFPVIENRFLNVFNWMSFIQQYRFGGETGVYHFKGIILTGWSRYTHMDPPCELLPVSYPSLVINLLLIDKFKSNDKNANMGSLFLEDDLEIFVNKHLSNDTLECAKLEYFDESRCKFDGQNLYNALAKYYKYGPILAKGFDDLDLNYFNYYPNAGVLNTNKVLNYLSFIKYNISARRKVVNVIRKEMDLYYEKDFINEYVDSKTLHDLTVLQSVLDSLKNYTKVRSWPRRNRNNYNSSGFVTSQLVNKTNNDK